MTLVCGPLSDAFGRRNVVRVSVVACVAASVGCALAPSVEWRLAMRIGEGRALAGVLAPALSLTRPGLATGMPALNAIGLFAWLGYQRMPGAVAAHAP